MANLLSDHADAFLDLLDADDNIELFDGKVPDPTPAPPYVVAYLHMESQKGAIGTTLEGLSTTVVTRAILHCVGATAAAARAMQFRARATLLDVRPVIAGRVCDLICEESSAPPDRDESTGSLVMDAISVYRFNSFPA